MSYNSEYPYTDATRYNSDWALNKIKDLQNQIDNISEDILKNANKYTDEKIAVFQSQVDSLRRELTQTENRINSSFNQFTNQITSQLLVFDSRIDSFRYEINADIVGVNARTDEAIKQNNEFLLLELSKNLAQITVVNYFTGLRTSVQDMFDYLAGLHVDNGISYNDLRDRDKTYTEFAQLNITYTQLAINGDILVI